MLRFVLIVALTLYAAPAFAGGALQKHISYLTSDECAGREVGTPGHDLARDYIVEQMKDIGLLPAGTDGWFVSVDLVKSARPSVNAGLRIGEAVLAPEAEYQIMDFSDGYLHGQAIFLGYGLIAPQYGWDDYGGHDVRNRIVVAFTGAPPRVREQMSDDDRFLLSLESKAAVALARGATGIVFVNAPSTSGDGTGQHEDVLRAIRPAFPLRGIAAVRVTKRAATRAFGTIGLDIADYQHSLDFGRPQSIELLLDISGELALDREIVTVDNIVGKLGGGGSGPPIVVGAHYDHLGFGGPASLAKDVHAIHRGANDNASGVAVMLDVARRLRRLNPNRPVYFVATTGEERGLRGSRRLARVFAERFGEPATYLNLDMVGRLQDRPLIAYVGHESAAWELLRDGAARAQITLDRRGLLGSHSDHLAFADVGWDAVDLTTGITRDYHTPSDTPDKLDWQGIQLVSDFLTATVRELAHD